MFIKRVVVLLVLILLFCMTPSGHAESNAPSLQQMLTQAEPGETLVVPAGIYHGPVTITKPIVLRAEPGAIIEGNGSGSVVTIAADDVTVEGFTIRHGGQNSSAHDAGVKVQGARVLIKDNRLEYTLFGVHLHRSSASHIIGNRIEGSTETSVAKRGNGIHITAGGSHMIERNEIAHVQDGVYFDQTTGNTVQHNTVDRSRYGYHVMFSDHNRITANETKNSIVGAMVMAANDITVRDNAFHHQMDVQGYGIFLYDVQASSVYGNHIFNNTIGIALDMVERTQLERNKIAHNAVGVKRMGEVEDTHLRENVLIGNVRQIGGDVSWSSDVWSRDSVGNYWDDYRGWDFNKDGIGDGAYRMAADMQQVFEKHPFLGIFYASPLHQLLDHMAADYPVFDEHPLMDIPLAEENQSKKENI
ncbi:nitrous oxide reductase family maturation protein NosD [Aneurinibacillus sp. REN35]|uniref:nitrous oxide reductase family maturation protein NosD n=1 Tax=Aneurinibacillus sp. REN35 TaxID=3237286 RepID=UPI0035294CF5